MALPCLLFVLSHLGKVSQSVSELIDPIILTSQLPPWNSVGPHIYPVCIWVLEILTLTPLVCGNNLNILYVPRPEVLSHIPEIWKTLSMSWNTE